MKNIYFLFFTFFLAPFIVKSQNVDEVLAQVSQNHMFTENAGQIYDGDDVFRDDVAFVATFNGMNVYFTNHGIVHQFYKVEPSQYDLICAGKIENPYSYEEWEAINKEIAEGKFEGDLIMTKKEQYRIDLEFPGADLSQAVGEDLRTAHYNYFHPNYNDGIDNVSNFGKIRYQNAYPGIDLVFYFEGSNLKYDFEVSSGADISKIKMLYVGHQDITIDEDGNAIVQILPGQITENAPVSFQLGANVETSFILNNDTLMFDVPDYDVNESLIIDPELTWATYYHEGTTSSAFTYTRPQWDSEGNMFIVHDTYNKTVYPTVNPGGSTYYDASAGDNGLQLIIMKLNPDREIVWATYYVSSQSASTNFTNQGLVIDGNDNIYCVGHLFFVYASPSPAFPLYNAGGYYETDLGNNRNFILSFDNDGVRRWATMFNSPSTTSSSGLDLEGLAIDSNNKLLIGGQTYTPASWVSIPTQNPGGSHYYNSSPVESRVPTLHRFSTSFALEWSTYISRGTASSYCGNVNTTIDLDASNNIFMASDANSTYSTVNPGGGAYIDGTGGSGRKISIYKFLSSGSLNWCTLYGGNASANSVIWQDIRDLRVNSAGTVFLVGRVNTTNFPTYNPGGGAYIKSTLSTGGTSVCDGVILKFSNGGVRQWATYYGGNGTSDGTDFCGLGMDEDDNIYVAGLSRSTSFPCQTRTGSYNQSSMSGAYAAVLLMFNSSGVRQWGTYYGTETWFSSGGFAADPWVCGGAKLMMLGTAKNTYAITTLNPGSPAYYEGSIESGGTTTDFFAEFSIGDVSGSDATITPHAAVCINDPAFNFTAADGGGTWSGTGITNATNGTFNPSVAGAGTHTITYTISGTCGDVDTETITVYALPTVSASASPTTICDGSSTTLTGSGANSYSWSSGGTGTTTVVSPSSSTSYTVTGTNTTTGCSNTAQVSVTVTPLPSVSASATTSTICNGESTTISASGATTYNWSHSLGTNSAYSVSPSSTTTYTVTGTSSGCTNTASVTVTVNPVPSVSASATTSTICDGESTTISASGASTYNWSHSLGTNSSYSVSPSSTTTYTVTGTSSGCTNTASVTVTVNPVP
ncbi:MAG: hypothetical protein C0592_14285, partial [Marinilabiliales bacterium]